MSLALAASTAAAVAVLALRVLRAPALALLTELCTLEHRARFWWRVVEVQTFGGTALCLLLAGLADAGDASWQGAVALLRGALLGLLLSVATVSLGVLLFERQLVRYR